MLNPAIQTLYDHVKRLVRKQAYSHVKKILVKCHPAEVTAIFPLFDEPVRLKLFQLIESPEKRAAIISGLDYELLPSLLQSLEMPELVSTLEKITPDDLADILASLPEEMRTKILEAMKKEEKAEVEGLMTYPENTAGGLMSPDYLALEETVTVAEAIRKLQTSHNEVEVSFYVYVINERGELVGVISLRQLVTSPPETKLKEIMEPRVISVKTHDDQEEVAHVISRYDLLAVPVVEGSNKLVGVVTVDDIIDVLREEATEDMLKMAGAGKKMVEAMTFAGSFRHRFPWLLITWIGGSMTALIIGAYHNTLSAIVPLAAFMPMITGMSGNVGTQSATVVVRALATGRVNVGQIGKVLGREVSIGLLMGFLYGVALGVFGFFKYMDNPYVNSLLMGGVVAMSMCIGMTIAALVATTMPFLLQRLNLDPAAATGPFVTTSCDIIGIAIYLSVATAILL